MSNVYKFAHPAVQHYQIPRALDQWLNSISRDELRLLLLIHSETERVSRSEVLLSTTTICSRTGIHATNIGAARQGLIDYKLIQVREEKGRQYTYCVVYPGTQKQVPDKMMLEEIDFNASPSVLTKYIKAIITDIKPSIAGLTGHCPLPNHPDTTASFTMDVDKGGKWWCRGCNKAGLLIKLEMHLSEDAEGNITIDRTAAHRIVSNKLRALGLGKSAKGKLGIPANIVYRYRDEEGDVLFESVRRRGEKSKTTTRRPDPAKPGKYVYNKEGCRNVLYHLPEIIEAYTVIVTEGEKDADTLTELGLLDSTSYPIGVTTNCFGAGNWLPEHSETLKHKRVILLGDTDERGIEHMKQVQESLEEAHVATLTNVLLPAPYKDVTEFLESNRTQKLIDLVGEDWLESVEVPGEVIEI